MSHVSCHVSHVNFLFWLTKWLSLLVEGLLSLGSYFYRKKSNKVITFYHFWSNFKKLWGLQKVCIGIFQWCGLNLKLNNLLHHHLKPYLTNIMLDTKLSSSIGPPQLSWIANFSLRDQLLVFASDFGKVSLARHQTVGRSVDTGAGAWGWCLFSLLRIQVLPGLPLYHLTDFGMKFSLPWQKLGGRPVDTAAGAWGWLLFSLLRIQVLPGLYHLTDKGGNMPLFDIMIPFSGSGGVWLLEIPRNPSWCLVEWIAASWQMMRTRTERGWRRDMWGHFCSSFNCWPICY